MRPTIDEQIRETRRILADFWLPQIDDAYRSQIATMLLANLEMLETNWKKVLPFLAWDNAKATDMLEMLREDVNAELVHAIDAALVQDAGDTFDVTAQETRNETLQALLCRAIGFCTVDHRRAIRSYLLDRTARYPMRPMAASLPRFASN